MIEGSCGPGSAASASACFDKPAARLLQGGTPPRQTPAPSPSGPARQPQAPSSAPRQTRCRFPGSHAIKETPDACCGRGATSGGWGEDEDPIVGSLTHPFANKEARASASSWATTARRPLEVSAHHAITRILARRPRTSPFPERRRPPPQELERRPKRSGQHPGSIAWRGAMPRSERATMASCTPRCISVRDGDRRHPRRGRQQPRIAHR
jgi:hypothetical protein